MSLTLQHNRKKIITNHNITCSGLMAYYSYVRVILALSPNMASISKKRRKKGFGTPPNLGRKLQSLQYLYVLKSDTIQYNLSV